MSQEFINYLSIIYQIVVEWTEQQNKKQEEIGSSAHLRNGENYLNNLDFKKNDK